jgi:hypothetical protein
VQRSREWLVPLTGVVFLVLVIASFIVVGGEPEDADSPTQEIVGFYVDNKDEVQVGAILSALAGIFLIFFGAYLRSVLRSADERDVLPLVSFIGLVIVALGAAIDATLSFAISEAADGDRVDPVAIQALQAFWDNDWLPFMVGILCFLWATGLCIVRTGVLPKWLGYIMLLLGVVGAPPVGFAAFLGSALVVLVLSVMRALRARGGGASPVPPPA